MKSKHIDEISPTTKSSYKFIEPKRIIRLGLARDGLYTILGLTPSATSADIKQAYRRMARDFHPDKRSLFKDKFNIDTTEAELTECFKYISAASYLSDPSDRAKYDSYTKNAPSEAEIQVKASNSQSTKKASPNQSTKQGSASSPDYWFERFYKEARQNKIDKLRSALEKVGMSSLGEILDDRIIRLGDLTAQLADAGLLNPDNLSKMMYLFSTDNPEGLPYKCIRILDNIFETLSEHRGLFTQANLDTLLSLGDENRLNELNTLTKLISEKQSLDQDVFDRSLALVYTMEVLDRRTPYSHASICISIFQKIEKSIKLTPKQVVLIFEYQKPIDHFTKSIFEGPGQAEFWQLFFENAPELFDFLYNLKKGCSSMYFNDMDWQNLGFAAQVFFTLKRAGIESTVHHFLPTQYMHQMYLLIRILESRGLLNRENAKRLLATNSAPHNRLLYYKAGKRFDRLPKEFKTNDNFLKVIHAPEKYAQLIPLFVFSDRYDAAADKIRRDIEVTSIHNMFEHSDVLISQLASTQLTVISELTISAQSADLQLGFHRKMEQHLMQVLKQSLAARQLVSPAIENLVPIIEVVDANDSQNNQQTIAGDLNSPALVMPYSNMAFFLKGLCVSLLICALTMLILSYAAPGVALHLGMVLQGSLKALPYMAGTTALASLVGLFALNQRNPNLEPSANNPLQQGRSLM